MEDNVAQGDKALFDWIVGWFADIFQNPSSKPGTSLGLIGPKGVGKTIVGKAVGSLIGYPHYMPINNPRYITGTFNAHMKALLLLHADEAFWAGDKKGVGILNDIVTGDEHLIEFKFFEPILVKNYLRLFVTGNPGWLVPASFDERRFAVLTVGESHKEDHPYFAAIEEEMNNGGREALLYHLLNFDLSKVNLRKIPKTQALLEQKIATANPEEGWWLDMLMNGNLPPNVDMEPPKEAEQKPPKKREQELNNLEPPKQEGIANSCYCSDLFNSYILHAGKQGVSRKSIEVQIGMFLNKVVDTGLERKQASWNEDKYYYIFPPLAVCRARFAKKLQQDVPWPAKEQWSHAVFVRDDTWKWWK